MATKVQPSQIVLITDLQKESENVIGSFCCNKIVEYPENFQSIITNRIEKIKNSYKLLSDNNKIDPENSVTLLGIKKDNKLNFEKNIATLYQKASR